MEHALPEFAGSRYPGPVDGVTRFQSIEGEIITSQFTLGAAWRFAGTGLSLGVSGSVLRSWINDVLAWSNGGNDVTHEGRSLLDASGYSVGFGAGALYEVYARSALARPIVSIASERPRRSAPARLAVDNDIGGPSSSNGQT